jgi:hypothetical protein
LVEIIFVLKGYQRLQHFISGQRQVISDFTILSANCGKLSATHHFISELWQVISD